MASELSWRHTATGETLYATIRSAARTYWNTAGAALEALTVANWADYDIALVETPASSYFHVGDWPAALTTPGWYWVDVYKRTGGSPAISDTLLGTLLLYWDGTTAAPWGALVSEVAASTKTGYSLTAGERDTIAGVVMASLLSDLAAVPGATPTLTQALSYAYMMGRNHREQTATTHTLYRDDNITPAGTSTESDDGIKFTRGKFS